MNSLQMAGEGDPFPDEQKVPNCHPDRVEVKFDALKDPAERTYCKRLPTPFCLPAEEVDKVRQAAGRFLNESRDFKRLLRDLQ